MASSDSCLYFGHEFMKYWRDAKLKKDEEAKSFYALGERWMNLYNYCKDIREQFKPNKNDIMILPNEMYNADGQDLLGEHISELEKYYNAKIILG